MRQIRDLAVCVGHVAFHQNCLNSATVALFLSVPLLIRVPVDVVAAQDLLST